MGVDVREFPGGLLRLDPAFACAEPPPHALCHGRGSSLRPHTGADQGRGYTPSAPRPSLPCTQHGLETASISTEALLPAEGPLRKGHGCVDACTWHSVLFEALFLTPLATRHYRSPLFSEPGTSVGCARVLERSALCTPRFPCLLSLLGNSGLGFEPTAVILLA